MCFFCPNELSTREDSGGAEKVVLKENWTDPVFSFFYTLFPRYLGAEALALGKTLPTGPMKKIQSSPPLLFIIQPLVSSYSDANSIFKSQLTRGKCAAFSLNKTKQNLSVKRVN